MGDSSFSDHELHWADYLVFTTVLVISMAIGLLHAYRARTRPTEDILLGQRQLPLLPVVFSLSVSFVSAVSVLGVPSEIYVNGADYWMIAFGFMWPLVLIAFVILPILYGLKLTSAYKYLEYRFNRVVCLAGSLTFIFLMLCYMSVVLYAPALALSQVTDLSMEVSILTVGLICTIYTSFGGIKAVIWTDVFQTLVITVGLCVLIARGTVEAGGVASVIDKVRNGSKESTWPMDPDPFVRHTFWTLTIGGGIGMLAIYASNQASMQRYLSVDTLPKAKLVLLLNVPLAEIFLALLCISGLVMYAYYQGRDPLAAGRIQKRDQLLPLFVMDIFGHLHGLPGLFIASVFSAALSTVSSGVNSLAIVTTEDFIKPIFTYLTKRSPQSKTVRIISMSTAICYGGLTIGMAYLAGQLSSTLLIIVVSIFGMVGGPLLGLMLLGIFCPWVNAWGAVSGLCVSLGITMWTAIGAITQPFPSPTDTAESDDTFDLDHWYKLSYQHYGTLAVIVALLVGTVVSLLTGRNQGKDVPRETYYDVLRPCRRSGQTVQITSVKDFDDVKTSPSSDTKF